ncbi:hypothetical protein HMPREF0083_04382 [Aneurinibacillus aneurinilyticus ATCC 12856]|uniref:Uncharacterized protein n=1 Tax=Aneurinibacillus aneurinilyticus ATCC 12856 TaxID=649747 RepID=U1WXW8_ANEAE|nr:hypothetical protein HMPREF0083_04382 [Aneurinibacillus aneurinilyticus ATCC 12856]
MCKKNSRIFIKKSTIFLLLVCCTAGIRYNRQNNNVRPLLYRNHLM